MQHAMDAVMKIYAASVIAVRTPASFAAAQSGSVLVDKDFESLRPTDARIKLKRRVGGAAPSSLMTTVEGSGSGAIADDGKKKIQ